MLVFFWNKGTDGRRWNTKHYYHPNCWVAQGLDYLKLNPYVSTGKRGQPKLQLTEEDRRTRYLLLRRKATLDIRLRDARLHGLTERVADLTAKSFDLLLQIAKVGGIPKRWAEDIINDQ